MILINYVKNLIYPRTCSTCRKIIPFHKIRCDCSNDDITFLSENVCLNCANEKENCICKNLYNIKLDHLCAAFVYKGIIKQEIIDFKFHGKTNYSKYFTSAMSQRVKICFKGTNFDYICGIPMFNLDFYDRGYNQSYILARDLSHLLKVPYKELLTKDLATQKQHKQKEQQRRENLKNAFSLKDVDINGKTILICDDIKSTGTTLKTCCDVLYENGAAEVYCVCIAVSDYAIS